MAPFDRHKSVDSAPAIFFTPLRSFLCRPRSRACTFVLFHAGARRVLHSLQRLINLAHRALVFLLKIRASTNIIVRQCSRARSLVAFWPFCKSAFDPASSLSLHCPPVSHPLYLKNSSKDCWLIYCRENNGHPRVASEKLPKTSSQFHFNRGFGPKSCSERTVCYLYTRTDLCRVTVWHALYQ